MLETEPISVPGHDLAVVERIAVQSALDALPSKYRIPLVLYVYEGQMVAEIAETLGLSISAVKMRLSRARIKFRQIYGQEKD